MGAVKLQCITTDQQIVDILTKPSTRSREIKGLEDTRTSIYLNKYACDFLIIFIIFYPIYGSIMFAA
jgi:hypothetical protein